MKNNLDLIHKLVKHAANTAAESIPEEVMKKAGTLFMDTVACVLSGSSAAGIKELEEVMSFWGGNSQSTILSFNKKTSAPNAAFLNSVMAHANDFDDTHDAAINHGCVTIVPAMLAVSEALPSSDFLSEKRCNRIISGKDFIAALAVGLDISNRLGMAFIPWLHTGWLPTTLWGPFAAAAACGRLIGLNEEEMHNAFGLAYSQIHGNRQALADGVLAKRMQPGFSAMAGVNAAFFAANGITGAKNIIDGDFGISALYTGSNIDRSFLTDNLGNVYETMNISIKPYPCCRCTHPVIDAALYLKEKHSLKWKDIIEGTIFIPPNSMGQIGNKFEIRDNPTVDAQFSAQYTASLAFLKGRPRLEDFQKDAVMSNTDVLSLVSRFKTVEFEKDKSGLTPVEMHITTKDGSVYKTRVENPKGGRDNPLTKDEMEFKFMNCINNSIKDYSVQKARTIFDGLGNVLDVENIVNIIQLLD